MKTETPDEQLEAQLRALPLRAPSAQLDARIDAFLAEPNASPQKTWLSAMFWRAAVACAIGLACFVLGINWRQPPSQPAAPVITPAAAHPPGKLQVIYVPAYENAFDMTRQTDDGLRPEFLATSNPGA